MRILFMGTPEFAEASLKAVYEAGHDICGVFTQPDKRKNRGMKLSVSPVKKYALSVGLEVFQPDSVRTSEVMRQAAELSPELISVVAYGKILPVSLLEIPRFGAVNVHGSLLPKYRGSAPIQWALLNGERETGVTTMHLAEKMDAGDMIGISKTAVSEYETFGELYDRLKVMGAKLLVKTLSEIENGTAGRVQQDESLVTMAPPIRKEDCRIDWTSAEAAINKIRAFDPKPGAYTELDGASYKLFSARRTDNKTQKKRGSVVSAGKDGLEIACGNGETVMVYEIQAPGGKRMNADSFLRGHAGLFERSV